MGERMEKNSYELLNLPSGASEREIEEAYIRARTLYGEDSVATYSLYTPEEREALLRRIIDAYETLKDPAKRRAYDTRLKLSQNERSRHDGLKVVRKGQPIITKQKHKTVKPMHIVNLTDSLVVVGNADQVAAEHYRILYTMLEAISARDSSKTFVVTSAVKGEGKTTTVLNLAYVMAKEFKKKTVVVECDLKNPTIISNYMKTAPKRGLAETIMNESDFMENLTRVEESDLYILPVIRPVRNSSELLSSQHMADVLSALKTEFDFVLIDSPPILPLADVNILSKMVDGLLLVVRAGKTPKDVVLSAVNSVTNTNIVGIVLNGVSSVPKKYSYSYGGDG